MGANRRDRDPTPRTNRRAVRSGFRKTSSRLFRSSETGSFQCCVFACSVPGGDLSQAVKPFLRAAVSESPLLERATEIVRVLAPDLQQRVMTLSEIPGWIDWIVNDSVVYNEKAWHKSIVKGRAVPEVIVEVISKLTEDDFQSSEGLEEIVMGVGNELSERIGARVLSQAPVRVAVTGTNVGLPLWEPLRLLGKKRTLERLQAALERLRYDTPHQS